jgi:hypothetical protein
MRFDVRESLRGDLGNEVTVETGSGGGDCGTPLPPGERFLIFAYKNEKGELSTGLCNGNQALADNPGIEETLEQYRELAKKKTGSIHGEVWQVRPLWNGDSVRNQSESSPVAALRIRAVSESFTTFTPTDEHGAYEFSALPNGKYTIVPEVSSAWDFDRTYEEWYQQEVSYGGCARINFILQPSTRIRGTVIVPTGFKDTSVDVAALPTFLRESELNQFSGQWDFTVEGGRFDLWPLPPGDYYVGVNINSSPSEKLPFPPTYYPGVTDKASASIVHIEEGEVKELELRIPEVAKERVVRFTAFGLDGKPLRRLYVQLEDLRHPGDAASYVNIDLDENGASSLKVFSGYSCHLHASLWIGSRNFCSRPAEIPAGNDPAEAQFRLELAGSDCEISAIDGLR